ncbi:MAG: anhydro-N-acetylmuramic acid kinase [Fusobacteria bacterium]|nr:anhydro-N-acetylmuramic acid kinase [Fusobacteriota bacterium]
MYYIGIMSGTSVDGIDAVLVDFIEKYPFIKLIETLSVPFEENLRSDIVKLLETFTIHLQKLGEIDHRLGLAYANAALILCEKAKINISSVVAIGCHGQTIFHDPRGKYPFTMQIGDSNIIAAKTGISVVNDFRRLDMAFNGDGAPLTPVFNQCFLYSKNEKRAILNLGGIANITILADLPSEVLGFDNGPANCLMDLWIQKKKGVKYDKNGDFARSGRANTELLNRMLSESYFMLPAPKSTGKELFNLPWLESILMDYSLVSDEDVQATLLDLTLKSLVNDIKKYCPKIDALYLCGGGAYNTYLVEKLKESLGDVIIETTQKIGLHPQWMEAVAFAWFAKRRIEELPANLPSVTGANQLTLLGALYKSNKKVKYES